ncbi:MAG: phage portal protein, partial [Planctomycetaceae bacterium]|nr:phage portal protein [Planctomycetaceae bacterium]
MIKQAYENAASLLWLPEQEREHLEEKRSWQGFNLDPSRSQRNPSGIRITPDTALQSTTVLACVRVLGESVASLPCNLYRKTKDGGKELATEHPLFDVLNTAPNSWQTAYEFFEQMMLHVTLHGNAYSYVKSGKKGFATELIPLHPTRVQCERLENGRLRYTYTQERGKQVVYSQDKIVHLRWLSDDGVTGMVPVQLSQDAIALSRACEIHGSAFFGNGAMPGICLETDQVLDQSSATALRENWERMHRSSNNAFRTAVLMGGLKAHELGSSNSDSQFLETRRMQVEEICRIFRCPPHLVGDLSRSSFSNIEQQSIDFLQHTL